MKCTAYGGEASHGDARFIHEVSGGEEQLRHAGLSGWTRNSLCKACQGHLLSAHSEEPPFYHVAAKSTIYYCKFCTTTLLLLFTALRFRVREEKECWPSSEHRSEKQPAVAKGKNVPRQFSNIELPGRSWLSEYNFIAIFTCLRKYTEVLDLWLPRSAVASLPHPWDFSSGQEMSHISPAGRKKRATDPTKMFVWFPARLFLLTQRIWVSQQNLSQPQ